MEKKKTKKEIVKMLLNEEFQNDDENELMELLFDEAISIDVDKAEEKNLKPSDKLADELTKIAGSWNFIIGAILFLIVWIIFNLIFKLDEYPFILLNLLLSCVAALQAPIIMMSQNRAAKKDTLRSKNDYRIDLKSELILEQLHIQISELSSNQKKIIALLNELKEEESNDK